ncbi:uncharacterized protein C11orf52 homolog [Thomomys bottae]
MGNRLCCGGSWSCASIFQKKNKAEMKIRHTSKQQQQEELQKNGTKGHEATGHTYELVLQQSISQRSQDLSSDSNLHYADIQVCSYIQSRSASEIKHQHLETATEYATLHFPEATPRYDSKNGTLV